jgi:flagellar hook-associated protein 3 FlgL
MSIRLNPDLLPSLLTSIQQTLQSETTASEELATGRSVNQLSDNPAAAAALVFNSNQASSDDQYTQNAGTLQARFQTADATLSNVVTVLTRAISIGTEGANGTVNTADRQAIAGEVQGLISQTLSLANTTYQGAYLFAGTAVNTQPFVQDPATGTVTYNGNTNTTSVQIANGVQIGGNLSGSQLFQNASGSVFSSLQDLYNALQSGTGNSIGAAVSEVQDALTQVSTNQVFYGNALNQISQSDNFLNQDQLDLSSQANTLEGADPAAAATDFSQAQVANQAVLSATAKVLNLPTLLDYLPTT